jgi:flagellar biosynthetic protein FliR
LIGADFANPSGMDLFAFDPARFISFLLTLIRISLLLFLLPFFGGKGLPRMVKAALCLTLTLGLWPALSFPASSLPAGIWGIALLLIGELVLGLVLGLLVRVVFAGIQTAGQIIGFQMGFAMMNVVDPMSGVSITLTSQFLYLMTLLLFLSLNGHLFLLQGLSQSFDLVPPGALLISTRVTDEILGFSSQIFVLAVKVAAPVMVAEFLVSLGLGIVARVAPQVNVLFVGFPVKIAVGFAFLGILLHVILLVVREFLGDLDSLYSIILGSI